MESSLRVSVGAKLDFETAMKDPYFAWQAEKFFDPTQPAPQREISRGLLRKHLAYGFEQYNYPE
jgi:hypothetical protein